MASTCVLDSQERPQNTTPQIFSTESQFGCSMEMHLIYTYEIYCVEIELKLFLLRVLCLWHSIGNCHIAFCILFCNLSVCPFTFAYFNRVLFYFVTLFSCHHRCPCLDAVDRAQDDHFELEYFCVIIESIFERAYLHQNI